MCVREATAPIVQAKGLGATNSCATGVLHHDVAHSEHFHESYTQVDPNVAHFGDGVSHLNESELEMSHNLDDDDQLSHILDHDFDLSQINDDDALLQMLNEHDVAIPELETPKTYPRGIRFSLEEIDIIKERAKAAGCSFNAYVRYSSLGDQYKPPLSQDVRASVVSSQS